VPPTGGPAGVPGCCGCGGFVCSGGIQPPAPGRCIFECSPALYVEPPYLLTDPISGIIIAGDFVNVLATATVVKTLPAVGNNSDFFCGTLSARQAVIRYAISGPPEYSMQVDVPSCGFSTNTFPRNTTTYATPVMSVNHVSRVIQCSPFKLTWTFSGTNATRIWGVSPAIVTLERI
jgi:hypothetical protein